MAMDHGPGCRHVATLETLGRLRKSMIRTINDQNGAEQIRTEWNTGDLI